MGAAKRRKPSIGDYSKTYVGTREAEYQVRRSQDLLTLARGGNVRRSMEFVVALMSAMSGKRPLGAAESERRPSEHFDEPLAPAMRWA